MSALIAPFRTIAESAAWLAELATRARAPVVHEPGALAVLDVRSGETLDEYLDRCGVEHFCATELVTLVRLGKTAPMPPRRWWPRIIPTLDIAERLRWRMGHPLHVGNGFRPRKLNREAGGASGSQHQFLRAVDLDLPPEHDTPENRRRFYRECVTLHLQLGRAYKMGLGLYASGSRAHIDTGKRFRFWKAKYYRPIRESIR